MLSCDMEQSMIGIATPAPVSRSLFRVTERSRNALPDTSSACFATVRANEASESEVVAEIG